MNYLSLIDQWSKSDRIAAVYNSIEMSYKELKDKSDGVAVFLIENYPRGEAVCLWGDKENEMLVYIFACMKSGHPYVILSSFYPENRMQHIVNIISPCVVLCAKEGLPQIDFSEIYTRESVSNIIEKNNNQRMSFDDYIKQDEILTFFFTSGSTGTPKCVPTKLGSAENIFTAYGDITESYIKNDINLKCLNIANYAFCSSGDVIFNNCIRFGMTLYAVSHQDSQDFLKLNQLIKKVNPHTFDCSPQFLSMCLTDPDFNESTLTNLRMLSVGGENLSARIGNMFLERFPNRTLCNGYGATEVCSGPMWCTVTKELLNLYDIMPIGEPIEGSSCWIEDDDGNTVLKDGIAGELIIKSNGLASGYLKDPDKTAEAFFEKDGQLCYRTKDIVKRFNGQYFYIGRKDNLVKVGGYRVELEEVEKHITNLSTVKSCAVIPKMQEGRAVLLIAYVVMLEKPENVIKSILTIKKDLSEVIPKYMIPQKIVFVDKLPVNSNGKVDRKQLDSGR